ncbi:protein involved in gliding motility SprA [Tenacibaculum skagerrakense]|uniref:Protein involved in gliding motility SprA n=1 Tax=Tenacibaculum skagerrakense TaxID=186571 RepID=A0A4R2P1Z3_9FLAO|nr:cell surface protein SprA [Tenacibaculum skagerrakense]TCP28108.1 protein involved in gliding motility SprA [Tenacibaculum skagerrakense]
MRKYFRNRFFTALAFLVSVVSFAQNTNKKDSISTKKDTIIPLKYDFNFDQKGHLFLNNPTDIQVRYDKSINKFVIVEKIGNYVIGTPIYLTPREYDKYRLKNDLKSYFKEKVDATNPNKKGNDNKRKNLLPKYYVNSKFFESVFGGNEVEVIPTGQISIKLGGIYQNTENPQVSIENQSSFTFDFDQQISASIQAKVGKRLQVTANYDTQSTFDFQNIIKVEYSPTEDDIIQKIDAGNVNLPIKNSLINGAQALFGVRADFQFGKTTIRTAFSQQNSQSRNVVAEGGAVIEPFELRVTDYDNDRHFFLSQYFRENYSKALANYPLVSSPININRIEVWVTNRNQNVQDYRSIVAFADIGESDLDNMVSADFTSGTAQEDYVDVVNNPINVQGSPIPYNGVNDINALLAPGSGIREVGTLDGSLPVEMIQGRDYSYLQNARKLQPNEYTLHPQLGFISLNRRLNDGEVLAVSYEYTVVGASNNETVFKVGEFSNDGINAPANIAVKLLRSEILTTKRQVGTEFIPFPTWRLMMKNVYALGAYPLRQEGFRFELLYRDDETGILQNTLQNAQQLDLQNRTLINLFNIDKLDQSQFKVDGGDGFFDYVEGITVNSAKGLIYFPEAEPFGIDLEAKITDATDQSKYLFKDLYLTTKIQAKNEFQNKDKFFLKGYFKSEASRGISLGASNIPRGSVRVSAGGRTLVEGVDYVVDYQLGRVQILDPGLEASGVPINASVENNTFFNQQRKTFLGVDIEHKINENFIIGGTFLNVSERPITPKVNFGAEPIDNVMLGFNLDFSSEVPYFTKLVNKLPFVETDAPSNISVRADMAYLLPGSPSGIDVNGTATSYLDDFEATQIPINLTAPQQWFLASTPLSQPFAEATNDPRYNFRRGKLSWYSIDQLFYSNSTNRPSNINDIELSRNEVRQISFSELFPNTDLDITQLNLVRTLDLAYFPNQRGPYNFNTETGELNGDGTFSNPSQNWGGIMRALTTTNNFEQANVEYIQFWLMDPYEGYSITTEEGLPSGVDPQNTINQGKLFINLGSISEDILRDSQKQFENGLSTTQNPSPQLETNMGTVPRNPSILYAFSADADERTQQDIGLDGLSDSQEQILIDRINNDPNLPINIDVNRLNRDDLSGDNFQFFRGSDLDATNASILTRYKNYNGTEGNSPTTDQSGEDFPTSGSTYPDAEDLNRDQTMDPVSAYFEYEVSLKKNDLVKGTNFIVDVKSEPITLPNGESRSTKWYQFRIPVRNGFTQAVGGITDFNSIRFMRMYLTEFNMPVVMRFAELELVRGDWRRYTRTLDPTIPEQDLNNTELNNFEVGVVSIEQNDDRYELPPGITREQLQGTNRIQRQNEQSSTITVNDLEPGKARAIFKNISIDLRRYKNLRMFLHAEQIPGKTVSNGDMSAIIRLGTDLNENYYEIEKPLNLSTSSSSPLEVWPEENNLDILMTDLSTLKLDRDGASVSASDIYSGTASNGLLIKVKGNPTLAQVRTVMLGVKNTTINDRSVEVWFNELRAVGFDNKGGWAAVLNADTNFADVIDLSLAGRMSTVGFGNVDQRVQERSLEEQKQYNVSTNVQLGKMMPKNWNMQVPMSYSYGEEFIDPKFDPQYQDVILSEAKSRGSDQAKRNAENAQDYTRRKSISFINVKKNRSPKSDKKPKFYDVENVAVSYSFSEEFHKDYNIERFVNQNLMAGVNYNFNFSPFVIEPFKKSEKFKGKYWRFIKDLNFNPVPKNVAINSKINRNYNLQQSRNLIEGLTAQPELIQRRFLFDWDYTIGFDLTKSLQLNFNATNNYIYDSFGQDEKLEIFDKFFTFGRRNQYHQTLNATYKVPINKLPYLSFITSDYGYTADFDWQASSRSTITEDVNGTPVEVSIEDKVGNMIQNANKHAIGATIDFKRFYKTIGLEDLFFKKNQKPVANQNKGVALGSKGTSNQPIKLKKNASFGKKLLKATYDVLTSVKTAKINFTRESGTLLQGFRPSVGFLGRSNFNGSVAPTLGFVFGSQTDMLREAISNGWLVTRDEGADYFNKNYGRTRNDNLDYNISIKPLNDFTIDLRGNRIKTSNTTQQLDIVNYTTGTAQNPDLKAFETGNYSISHFMLGTMFTDADQLYQNFLDNRVIIANRIGNQNPTFPNDSDPANTNAGYKTNGQQVMLPAFLAAYSGTNVNSASTGIFRNIPLPNWTMRYNGLMKFKWFKKNFSSFTLSHSYKSSYTIVNFTNNLQYDPNGSVVGVPNVNNSGNYQPELLISSATLIDEFSPLIKVDMKMRNSFSLRGEIKKDRSLNLNFNNNTLTDIKGTEFIFGLGYRIKDVKMVTHITGKKETLKGDINLRADVSLRDNLTLIRSVDEQNNQITGGERLFGLKFLADYNLSRSLRASFYYNHNTFDYAISTNFPRQSINAGFNIVYNLGN